MARVHYLRADLDRFRKDDIRTGEVEVTEDDLEVVVESEALDDEEPEDIYMALQGHTDTHWNEAHEIRSMSAGDVIEFSDGRTVQVARIGFDEVDI